MLGGYQIINLTDINVALNSEMTAISNRGVLNQLLALREYIEDNYNFTRPLNKKLKPVMLRFRDKESGEKTESSLWANLAVIDDNLSFNIDAVVSVNPLKVLQINVVFEKKQDEDENDYYDIKSAGYLYKGGNDIVTVSDIKNIDSNILDKLQCGDIVLKHDSSGDHAYIVSYRGATGICLTYTDASVVETQSYDLINSEWTYNSEDKSYLPLEGVYIKSWNGTLATISGVVYLASFCKIVRNFNELNIIYNVRIKNNTDDSLTINLDTILATFESLPDDVNSLIYGHNGKSLSEQSGNMSVAMTPLTVASTSGGFLELKYLNLFYNKSENALKFYLEGSSLTLTANQSADLEGRISLSI